MSTQIDWRDELDSSFGDGADRPAAAYLPPARAALRRRRTALGAAVLAGVLVVGGIGWAALPGSEAPRTGEVATEAPSPTPEPSPTPGPTKAPAEERVDFLGNPATYDSTGELRLAPGWRVVERVANPMGYTEPGLASVALRTVRDGDEQFVMLAGENSTHGMSASIHSNDAVGSLSDWLTTVVATQRTLDRANATGSSGPPIEPFRRVGMKADGELTMPEGASVVALRATAELPPVLQLQGGKAVAAQVDTADGTPLWVFARLVEGRPQVEEFTTAHDDLDAFVAWVAKQFKSGGGLR